jgi:rhamnose transport system permease protein
MANVRVGWRERWSPNGEWALVVLLAAEVAIFSWLGTRFWSVDNFFEVVRLAAEVGLLALGLTLVIKSGGIDLSVGSMMALTAVVFGHLATRAGWPVELAGAAAVAVGVAGGTLHAALVARGGVPPLIVTLGTYSLFRGLAEAFTGGYETYTGFAPRFLWLGQAYVGGVVPPQAVVLAGAAAACWLVAHRAIVGRELTAVGFSREGARHGGVRIGRTLWLAYAVCGGCAALAGLIYVARIGQAKADAGLGFELTAIAAVVLGGTSINGGRGTVHGTMLGLFCLVVLQNGLRLAGQPAEIAGLVTGAVLIGAIAAGKLGRAEREQARGLRRSMASGDEGGFSMKNSQVAFIVAAILAGALLIAGTNFYLVRNLRPAAGGAMARGPEPAKRPVLAFTPKAKADPYFVSVREGAEEAAKELGVDLLWDGPTDPDPAQQNDIVQAWVTRGVDAIAASCASPEAISTVLRTARARGIDVLTWDADALPDARSFFVNQATARGIGATLADEGARLAGGAGDYAIITASLTDANQNEWIKFIKERMAAAHPQMTLVAIHPCDGQRDRAMTEARNITRAYAGVKTIIVICAPAVPGAAEALKQDGRRDVKLTGLSTPNLCRDYVHEDWIQSVVLWNTRDLGYLSVYATKAVLDHELTPGARTLAAGRLGEVKVAGDQVVLGEPFVFTKENIDRFRF